MGDPGGSWLAGLPARAAGSMSTPLREYVEHGSGASVTAGEATQAWGRLRLHPHVLRDVTDVDPSVALLGRTSRAPFGVAPTSLQKAVHPDGEVATARATAAAGAVMVVSSNAGSTFADIAATGVTWWLQVYLPSDRTLAGPLLDRAVEAGAAAVVLTVDTPVVATWHPTQALIWDVADPAWTRVNFGPGHDDQPGSEKALDLGPHDIDWLRDRTGLPVVVKGVLRGDDARRCVQAGAAAVWVSTHGGRQLDRSVSTADALPDVRAAVGEEAEVYVDGGVRSGLDVLTALAAGADAVFVGRPVLHALVDGEAGVARWHAALLDETVEAMRLAGCRTPADTRELLPDTRQERPHPL
ncbi:4-hydroxymandelate oxidase [Nocardioides marinisabuli]|uniref:4-hydroxymandelate oxidase n=1 Tax=Nocardioides marinisabuli TaxID=419476 RepID=A0A7Y9F4D7_9ACTN|nr:alpha-hydroxy acid oxidase [Nocardioides marinisabuli]NYD59428.1 4-hydroxymandelate oxidase [Nocardioides marinisabuli]